jgi:Zn-dependent protease with chaperone function
VTDPCPRQRRRAGLAFGVLCGCGLGAAAVAAAVVAAGVQVCWPSLLAEAGPCLSLLAAALLCWLLALTAAAAGAWQLWRTGRTFGDVLRRYPLASDARVDRVAAAVGVAGPIARSADARAWAATYGVLRPRIVVSAGLCDRLTDGELGAVLLHEAFHRRCREPLRLLLARSARSVLRPLPAAGRLFVAYVEASELAADAYAMDGVGRRSLAAALWRLRGVAVVAGAVPFGAHTHLFTRRVAQMECYPVPLQAGGPGWRDVAAVAGATALAVAWALLCLRA